jgi:surface antigen
VVVHTGPGIGFPANGQVLAPDTALTFDAWTLGSAHLDPTYSTQHYDDRWFRIAGTTTWVPSATINGGPGVASTPLASLPHKQALHNLLNVVNITDPDGNYPGQCVSFVKQFTHALGVDMHALGGNGGALNAFQDWNQPNLSLSAAQADRIPFTGTQRPQEGDIIVFDATDFNPYGHIGVVQAVIGGSQCIMEQSNYNDGAPSNTSVTCGTIDLATHPSLAGLGTVLGWLRLTHVEGAG